jgi:hypothetical protein
VNPIDQLLSSYKQGYKTTEFWVTLAVGLTQALGAAFDKNKTFNDQLSNLTWVGIAYILSRAGLKVVRVAGTAKVASAATAATAAVTTAATVAAAQPAPAAGSAMPALSPETLERLRLIVELHGSGGLTDDQFQRERVKLVGA